MQYFTFKPAAHLKSASTEMHDPENWKTLSSTKVVKAIKATNIMLSRVFYIFELLMLLSVK